MTKTQIKLDLHFLTGDGPKLHKDWLYNPYFIYNFLTLLLWWWF